MKTKNQTFSHSQVPVYVMAILIFIVVLLFGCTKTENATPSKQPTTTNTQIYNLSVVVSKSYISNGNPYPINFSVGDKISPLWTPDTTWSYFKYSNKEISFSCKKTDTLFFYPQMNFLINGGPDTCRLYLSFYLNNNLIRKDSGEYYAVNSNSNSFLWNENNVFTGIDTLIISKY